MARRSRLYPTPRLIVAGQPGTGWLGFASSWVILGFGAGMSALAGGALLSISEACSNYSDRVCGVSGFGGLLIGVGSLAVAGLLSIAVARGFGPPANWWVLPVLAASASTALMIGALAGADQPEPLPLVGAAVGAVVTIWLVVALARRGKAATTGWIRLDGLDAREVRHRGVDRIVFSAAAIAAFSTGAAFALHVERLLLGS